MSLLHERDILIVKLVRRINGKLCAEKIEISHGDVRYLSTPQLLRYFTEQIDRAQARLDATEEFSTPP